VSRVSHALEGSSPVSEDCIRILILNYARQFVSRLSDELKQAGRFGSVKPNDFIGALSRDQINSGIVSINEMNQFGKSPLYVGI
jgi:hypothetical protein